MGKDNERSVSLPGTSRQLGSHDLHCQKLEATDPGRDWADWKVAQIFSSLKSKLMGEFNLNDL